MIFNFKGAVYDRTALKWLFGWALVFVASIGQAVCGEESQGNSNSQEDSVSASVVNPDAAWEIAPGITIIPDPRIDFVPNIGIIEGERAVLVVDTGLGPENGRRILKFAQRIAGGRELILTTTHFHPEHNFGAQAFRNDARLVWNAAQETELAEKGPLYLELFRKFGPAVAEALKSTAISSAEETYERRRRLDLGGREVVLEEMPAHTRGDQVVYIPDADVLFAGDLVETRFFPILPDTDASARAWIEVLEELAERDPSIVVPGHGAVGDAGLINALLVHLRFMQERVRAYMEQGESQEAVTDRMIPAMERLYPHWDNEEFLPFEIGILYAEITGESARLPPLDPEKQ